MPIHNSFMLEQQAGSQGAQPSARALQLAGPLLPVEISLHPSLIQLLQQQNQTVPSPVVGQALIDTGASVTAVDHQVLQTLNIAPIGTIQVGTAGGQQMQTLHPAAIRFPQIGFEGKFARVLSADLAGQGIIALIGRDVLGRALFVYNGTVGHFILSF